MSAKQFLDSLTRDERERVLACLVKLFADDAARFAKAAGISNRSPLRTMAARKSFL